MFRHFKVRNIVKKIQNNMQLCDEDRMLYLVNALKDELSRQGKYTFDSNSSHCGGIIIYELDESFEVSAYGNTIKTWPKPTGYYKISKKKEGK